MPIHVVLPIHLPLLLSTTAAVAERSVIPDDFPRFIVPGHETAMERLRELFYLHYTPAGPLATLWDEWLTSATLWPADTTDNRLETIRARWVTALGGRGIDPDGYVWTHQHASIAHQHGWPFLFWAQGGGAGVWGWHFSLQHVPDGWHGTSVRDQTGWIVSGGEDQGIDEEYWNLRLTTAGATVTTPELEIEPFQAPFIQLRWRAGGLAGRQPYLEWTTTDAPEFGPERRFYFDPPAGDNVYTVTMIPVHRSPVWNGRITRLRLGFDNPPGATVGIQALFTQYDTRHSINNPNFIRGCCNLFNWTRDLTFLRANLSRIRLAMRYVMDELGGWENGCVRVPWVGHDGRSGVVYDDAGEKEIRVGHGVGHNYWDLLPCGRLDAYGTFHYYDALLALSDLEEQIEQHPEWNLPASSLALDPAELRRHAGQVRETARKLFWNPDTGRYGLGIDDDGQLADYGYTFANCEAIYYDIASAEQARSILAWIDGERTVDGDTSQGDDIYHWRFAPRASTRRNIDWYGWYWSSPESIPFGYQVQDGGAVLGFSYHDLMARLKVNGPDDAWRRLRAILEWFAEVQAEGGYRAYYEADPERGTMQGGGTAGGLGLDREFFESILVPQVMLYGFLGFRPRPDGFAIDPRLPSDWPELTVTRIHLHRLVLAITVDGETIRIDPVGEPTAGFAVYLPEGRWLVSDVTGEREVEVEKPGAGVPLALQSGTEVRLTRR